METKGNRRVRIIGFASGLALVAAAALAGSAGGTRLDGDYGPDTCLNGFDWREAVPVDHVCVTPDVRTQAAQDNAQALSRVAPTGPYGVDTCVNGFVWREAVVGDHVCVYPQTRAQARDDNARAAARRNAIRTAVDTYVPAQAPCNASVCSRTSDDAARYRIRADRINVGSAYVGLYRIDGTRISWWRVSVPANTKAPGGFFSLATGRLQCDGSANAYFRVKDGSSGRWSSRQYVTTGCSTY